VVFDSAPEGGALKLGELAFKKTISNVFNKSTLANFTTGISETMSNFTGNLTGNQSGNQS
jgi:hypothetical protein